MNLSLSKKDIVTVNTTIQGTDGQKLIISAQIEPTPSGWNVQILRNNSKALENNRLSIAVNRLCNLDVAIKLFLESGQSVKKFIANKTPSMDGPHSATEQILPLFLPRKIHDYLYSYQRQGVAWLLRHNRALLGDDMGLGKTAQALSAARRLIRFGHADWVLVISPRTLIANWVAETARWAPELTIATALPSNQDRSKSWARLVRRAHIIFTSYEQIRKPADALIQNPPGLIIADEAHRLRKYSSLSTKGIRLISSKRFWALTGTPIERDTEDLTVSLSLLDPARFSIDDRHLSPMSLRARFRPYLLRRRKESIMSDLPKVIEENEVLELTVEQRESYREAIIDQRLSTSKTSMLPLFNSLRTICDFDPNTGRSSKLDRIIELISDIVLIDEKTVVFSYILEPLHSLARKIKENNPDLHFTSISGNMSLKEREQVLVEFKTNPKCYILLASTRVASEGLTLTEANNVIFINRWWNPSSNLQARDRVVRIGQSRPVNVKSFTCKDTVEERLDHLLNTKSLTFEQVVQALSTTSSDPVVEEILG